MEKSIIYLAIDFDGVLHPERSGPTRVHCAEYRMGKISCEEFIQSTNQRAQECSRRHGWFVGELFDRAELLTELIEKCDTDVRLVIATSWRNAMSVDAIKALLPSCLGRLVVGALDPEDDEYRELGIRGQLMESWIAEHASGANWLALDDVASLWGGHMDRLIQTPSEGLEEESAAELGSALHSLLFAA